MNAVTGRSLIPAVTLVLGLTVAMPGVAAAGDLANVKVVQAKDAASGVRMVELVGTVDGERRTIWLMISERNYAKMIGCKTTDDYKGPVIQYSDKSLMVNVVLCH